MAYVVGCLRNGGSVHVWRPSFLDGDCFLGFTGGADARLVLQQMRVLIGRLELLLAIVVILGSLLAIGLASSWLSSLILRTDMLARELYLRMAARWH